VLLVGGLHLQANVIVDSCGQSHSKTIRIPMPFGKSGSFGLEKYWKLNDHSSGKSCKNSEMEFQYSYIGSLKNR